MSSRDKYRCHCTKRDKEKNCKQHKHHKCVLKKKLKVCGDIHAMQDVKVCGDICAKKIKATKIVTDELVVNENTEHIKSKLIRGTINEQILLSFGLNNPISTPLLNGGSLLESSRNIETSVFELNGQLYGASCLHNQSMERINNNVAEMVTENIDPLSIIDTETLSIMAERAQTQLSDCWGWTWVDQYDPSIHGTVSDYMRNKQEYMHHYAFIGTNLDTFVFDVTNPRNPKYVQTIKNSYLVVNRAWEDCKVYDVTTLVVSGNVETLVPDKFIRLDGGRVIKILTVEPSGDNYIVRVETIDTVNAGDELAGSDYQIISATRDSYLYIVYERLSALQICNILPLMGPDVAVPKPMNSLLSDPNPIPVNTSYQTSGLKFTNVGATTIPGALDGPWYIEEINGDIVFRGCNFDNFVPGGGTPNDIQVPTSTSNLTFQLELDETSLPPGKTSVQFNLVIRYSTEPNFDFVVVTKNGEEISRVSGAGADASNPFRVEELPIDMKPGDIILIEYNKDPIWYSGVDALYFNVTNLKYIDEDSFKAILVNEIFDTDSQWVVGSSVIPFEFAHNVYVNNRDGRLYICGGITVNNIRLPILDIKTDPSTPIYLGGVSLRYFHDFVSENYSVEEQVELLGIPLDQVVEPYMSVGIGSNETFYSVIDVTDPQNIRVLSQNFLYEGEGYYHQAWFTTDKRFVIISDELQPKKEDYMQRNPIFRLYWKDGTLRMLEQQPLKGPYRARNHNLYTRSNRRMFPEGPIPLDFDVDAYYNSQPFEDWVFCSDYTAGATLYSIKYRPGYDKNSDKEFDNPFIWERVGQLMTNPYYDEHVFKNGWSIFPFGEWQVPAAEMTFYQNGGQNGAMGKYRQGFLNLEAASLLQDGELKLLHDAEDIPGELSQGTMIGKDGSYITVNLVFLGKDMSTDLTIFAVSPVNPEDLPKLDPPKLAESLVPGETLYANLDGRLVKAHDVVHSTTYSARNMGMLLNLDGSDTQYAYHHDRMSELILDVPAKPGHSGAPVVNKAGELVGMIRDHDMVGGLAGAIDLTIFKDLYADGGLQFITPTPQGFQDLYLNYVNGVEDQTKFASVAINPRNGRIAPILASNGRSFWLLPYLVNGDTEYNRIGDPITWAQGGVGASKLIKLADNTLWNTISFVPEWFFGLTQTIVRTYHVDVQITSGSVNDLLYMEEIRGDEPGNGPAMFFLSHLGTKVIDGVTYETLEYTPIPAYTDQGLYLTSSVPDKTLYLPQGGKIMTSLESGVTVQVIDGYVGQMFTNTEKIIGPSWIRTGPNQPGGAIPMYPFIKSTTVPPLGVPEVSGNNSVMFVQDVPENFQVASIVNITSDNTTVQLKTAMLGVQLESVVSNRGSVMIAQAYPMFEDQHTPENRFEKGDIIKEVDGIPATKDNIFALIMAHPAGVDAPMLIHRHMPTHRDIPIVRKRFQRYNTILKLA